jgi:hypothetical protein
MLLSIPESIRNQILSVIGYPLVTLDNLEEIGSVDNFNEVIMTPTMREYFKWFPLINYQEYQISSYFSIDFPTATTFTVYQSRINTAGFVAKDSNNPFLNNSIYRTVTGSTGYGGGQYGTLNDYGTISARVMERMERQSSIDTNKAFRVDIDEANRKISGFTNVVGKLGVMWGYYSFDWKDIPYRWNDDVIRLAQSKLLFHLGMLRGQQNSNLPNQFNYQLQLDMAKKFEDEVIKKFKEMTKTVLIRN